MAICVRSEVSTLKRVLLQRPGCELEQLVPNSLERLLFDDIPYLHGAQKEHDRFAEILRANGVDVVYLSDLAAQTLSQSDALKERFVEDFIRRSQFSGSKEAYFLMTCGGEIGAAFGTEFRLVGDLFSAESAVHGDSSFCLFYIYTGFNSMFLRWR